MMINTLIAPSRARLAAFFAVAGPGLVVMLADTDAGSVITAAQSGAQWGYKLLALQLLLDPDSVSGSGADSTFGPSHRARSW